VVSDSTAHTHYTLTDYSLFRLHRMHEIQTIVIDVRGLSVSLSVTRLNSAARAVCAAHSLQPLPFITLTSC